MYKYLFIFLFLSSCVKSDTHDAPGPVISFYKGIDPWTKQSVHIFRDTTIKGYKGNSVRVHFAAAATMKSVLIKLNDTVKYEKLFDNDNYYNYDHLTYAKPDVLPKTFVFYFKVTDYNNRSAEKTITLKCIP